jgi:hypothetical protein
MDREIRPKSTGGNAYRIGRILLALPSTSISDDEGQTSGIPILMHK